ncbi:hypothetical protein [Seramator thermalis]|jgi:flagellin-like hook-associated protein FlgL|uniref:hypothetical protein n=1 Tax=Seramator thermalis TaxID=2496270 RepID=UPI00101D35FC|nr:hypothetical protein [Seramator thermalis]
MAENIQKSTIDNLQNVSKILTKFVSRIKNADSSVEMKKHSNVSEIAKLARPKNLLQNLC